MIYTINNCTVSKLSQILQDSSFVCNYPLPKKVTDKLAKRLVKKFKSRNSGGDDEELKKLFDDFFKESIKNEILILQTLYRSLEVQVTEYAKEQFKEFMNKEYKPEYLNEIATRIKKLKFQIESDDQITETKFNFDEYIRKIEDITGKKTKDIYLYQFSMIEKEAMEKIKSNKNQNQKS